MNVGDARPRAVRGAREAGYMGKHTMEKVERLAAAGIVELDDRRVGIAELEKRIDVDRSTIAKWIRAGRFPPPHHIGRLRKWFASEIARWEMEQMAKGVARA